jgi:hypothetical protein
MLFTDARLYEQCRKLKLGEAELPPVLGELKRWIDAEYSINVVNIVCDRQRDQRPSLDVIVETRADYSKMLKERPERSGYNEEYQKAIAQKFSEIVRDFGLEGDYDTANLWVFYEDFDGPAMAKACDQLLAKDVKDLMQKFSAANLWTITGFASWVAVFYTKDSDVEENAKNGTSEQIKRECFRLVKQYDEFDYIHFDTFNITFDSKQNLDEHYQGNLYYYFK